jgi:hypothetical protein
MSLTQLVDPATSYGHTLRVRMSSTESGQQVKVSLRQGASTEIAAWTQTVTGTATTYYFTPTPTQVDAITDYTTLRLRIEAL